MSGIKHDAGKPRMSLIPHSALVEVAKVMTFGAKKYGDHNWRGGFDWSRLEDAARRHLGAWNDGQDHDPESGLLHTAHVVCCALMLLEHQLKGLGRDDRYEATDNVPDYLVRMQLEVDSSDESVASKAAKARAP